MPYVVIGGLLTVLELYRLAIHRTFTPDVPQILRVGIPMLFLLGVFRVGRRERPAVVLTASCFALVLNRHVMPEGPMRVGVIGLSTLSLMWVGGSLYRQETVALRGHWWIVGAVAAADAIACSLQAMR